MALRQGEAETPVTDTCRKLGVTGSTYYRWTMRYGGLDVSELRELRRLREENRKLKGLVADLNLDKVDPAGGPPKKMVGPAQRRTGSSRCSFLHRPAGAARVVRV